MLLKLIVLFTISLQVSAETNSEKFKSLNMDSAERQQVIKTQNARVNARLKSSENFKAIQNKFKTLPTEFTIEDIVTKNGVIYTLIDRGMGKPNELVETSATGEKQVIFSSLLLSRNNTYNTTLMKLNPSETKIILLSSHKGSTDDYKLITIDLATRQIVYVSGDSHYRGTNVFFKDDESLVIERNDSVMKGLATISILNNSKAQMLLANTEMWNIGENWIHAAIIEKDEDKAREQFIITREKTISLGMNYDLEILGVEDDTFFYKVVHAGKGLKADLVEYFALNAVTETKEKLFELNFISSYHELTENLILIENKQGFKKSLLAMTKKGKLLSTLEVPFCCSVGITGEILSDDKNVTGLNFLLASPMKQIEQVWSFAEAKTTISDEVISGMFKNDNFELVIEERFAKSFDGTMVPYRMAYKKGTELKNAAVYMEAYGGFNIGGYLANSIDTYVRQFIVKGGVYIGTGLRGGNEFGNAWHEAAMKTKKRKTFEDMASTAKDLIDREVTVASKIAMAGSSNGGLTVAATALLYPQYFGLALPHNGVLDMLGKESLDERFNFGWKHEYGDSRVEAERAVIETYAPLELVTTVTHTPRILVLNGRTDSRVNPAHSVKFAAAAASVGNTKVELYSINNSGHFNNSMSQADYIGWRLMTVKWTTLFDFFGMKF